MILFNCMLAVYALLSLPVICSKINREQVVRRFNPHRNASSKDTPMQVGNGNFAFGADVTGLQTFLPFNILSSWAWHNSSLPTTPNQTEPSDFTGLDWDTHGRLVNYEQPNPAEPDISQWMISNPHRVNLGRVGLWFKGGDVTEDDLASKSQYLDLYTGMMSSSFLMGGHKVSVQTIADPYTSTIAVKLDSDAIRSGDLGVFFDYPYMNDTNKFEAPFVGNWNAVTNHTTSVKKGKRSAVITHKEDALTYYTTVSWDEDASMSDALPDSHRYVLTPKRCTSISFTVAYSPQSQVHTSQYNSIVSSSAAWWGDYWEKGNFVDLTASGNATAVELQRRVILSQYLLAVNSAGHWFPQESGLTDNGWYGKFHLEMYIFHSLHFLLWGHQDLIMRSLSHLYFDFLPTSYERAARQGWAGAHWGKMSDPSGRSAPGEINSLLIWQQPHPLQFAEYLYRFNPSSRETLLHEWEEIVTATADFMASYAWWNASSGHYDLGPPMYTVAETTSPNVTRNPTFELAYWRFGLGLASQWKERLGKPVPEQWTHVMENLAPLPLQSGAYALYEGALDTWTNPNITEDHPASLMIYGWLPGPSIPGLNFSQSVFDKTLELTQQTWNFTYSFGWDFPLLAMTSARTGDVDSAIKWLLFDAFQFDDVGMPIGGARVPTPYFPGSGSLLMAIAFLAGGWDGAAHGGPSFPQSWRANVEGFERML